MIKKLPILSTLLTGAAMLLCTTAKAQINYTQEFEGTTTGWTSQYADDFTFEQDGACSGTGIFAYFNSDTYWDMVITSGTIGTSNGNLATLRYTYKITDRDNFDEALPNTPDWGNIYVEYAYNPATGPWTNIETVTPANHTESAECYTRTVNFTPPANTDIYLRIRAASNVDNNIRAALFFDDIIVTQAVVNDACTGTPEAAETISSVNTGCNGSTAVLSLNTTYQTAVQYQWQYSVNGTAFTDIAATNTPNYVATMRCRLW